MMRAWPARPPDPTRGAMDVARRRELARQALGEYDRGPDATIRAAARALARVGDAAAVVLVEGISDQIAVETAAAGGGRDLAAERVVILPIGGAHAIGRFLTRLAPLGVRLVGLCDRREEEIVRRGLAAAGIGAPETRADMERLGFWVCVEDLEDELIRAVGHAGIEELFAAQGDLRTFRSFQSQPAWRGRDIHAQIYRFIRSSSVRNLRYARLLVTAALAHDRLPRPIAGLLAAL